MAKVELVMPKMGESIIEATILKWNKKVGDKIEAEESALDIATDKVDSEVPSPVEGIIVELLYKEGDVVPVGKAIAIIETAALGETPAVVAPASQENATPKEDATPTVPYLPQPQVEPILANAGGDRFYSPLVLNIAREEKIAMAELETIPGTGKDGRVTKKDILDYVANRGQIKLAEPIVVKPTPQVAEAKPVPVVAEKTVTSNGATGNGFLIAEKKFVHTNYDIIEMDRMRKMTAENMTYSKHVSPHVTSYVEADVTNIVIWRNKNKAAFEKQYGEKLTFTPIFVMAIAKALREMPMVNISVDGDKILVKKDINVGVAVAMPDDNLIVPVIRNADRLNLIGLTAAVNDLAYRARNRKLKPEDLDGGTYTISNVGTFGNVMGTPIIMQPQVAILAVGAIRKLPSVVETEAGDMIAIRSKMFLSHSYDHRVINGALGGKFVRRVADILEAWDINMTL